MRRVGIEAEGSIMKGRDADGIAQTEADHHMQCPGCGQWFDMRDLGQVLAHVHDAEIEIGEGREAVETKNRR
jgi:CRISPR/Cas system type I-B associated protein Csh2 (Cas7 group RAMP superfamily)